MLLIFQIISLNGEETTVSQANEDYLVPMDKVPSQKIFQSAQQKENGHLP